MGSSCATILNNLVEYESCCQKVQQNIRMITEKALKGTSLLYLVFFIAHLQFFPFLTNDFYTQYTYFKEIHMNAIGFILMPLSHLLIAYAFASPCIYFIYCSCNIKIQLHLLNDYINSIWDITYQDSNAIFDHNYRNTINKKMKLCANYHFSILR